MTRYIDANKLHYSRVRIVHADGTVGGSHAVVMSAEIKDAPTADVVEVVRCKDCENYNGHRYCTYHADPVLDDDFCSCGERRTDNEMSR